MLTEKTNDPSLAFSKLDALILKTERRERKKVAEKLSLLFEVDSESKSTEDLLYSERVLVALALNRPDLIEDSHYVNSVERCILSLDIVEREVLRTWISIQEELSIKEHRKKTVKPDRELKNIN